MRISKSQKELLIIMTKAFTAGISEVKSTEAHALVCRNLKSESHPNNWRSSCELLEKHGFILRRKHGFDWFMNLTPSGFDKGVELIQKGV